MKFTEILPSVFKSHSFLAKLFILHNSKIVTIDYNCYMFDLRVNQTSNTAISFLPSFFLAASTDLGSED